MDGRHVAHRCVATLRAAIVPAVLLASAGMLLQVADEAVALLATASATIEELVVLACWSVTLVLMAWQGVLALGYVVARLARAPRLALVLGRHLLPALREGMDLPLRRATAATLVAAALPAQGAALARTPSALSATAPAQVALAADDTPVRPPWGADERSADADDQVVRPPWRGPTPDDPLTWPSDDAHPSSPDRRGARPDDGGPSAPALGDPTAEPAAPSGGRTGPLPADPPTRSGRDVAEAPDAPSPTPPSRPAASPDAGPDTGEAAPVGPPAWLRGEPSPRAATGPTAAIERVVVAPGDSLWRLAAEQLVRHDAAEPCPGRLAAHWRRVVATTEVPSGDPDLLHPGDVLELPMPLPPGGDR